MAAHDLDMRKLRYFVAVAEEQHFGRAAQRLHIAQPVLSRQIRAFEHDLGVELFARDSRGTQLTSAGNQLLADARFLLAESRAVRDRIARAAAPLQRITIGVMPGLLATAAVRAFEAADPSRRAEVIRVGWSDQVNAVRQGRADIVYAREPFDHSGLGMLPLLEEPRDVALHASDPLAAKASLRLVDLADRRLLQDPAAVPEWYEIATPAQRRACVGAAAQTVEEKLEMVAAAQGFVILPRSTTEFYRRPDVSVAPLVDIAPSRVILIWDAAASVAARDDFLKVALTCAAQTI
jgi:DNA-binding transcriptional LysR family regulator